MLKLDDYQVVLFDFDGLLVNTEEVHFEAYKELCRRHGLELDWDFATYCSHAHRSATGLREALQLPNWEQVYEEKCQIYRELIEAGKVQLMPGVKELLKRLESVKHAVVTHSRHEHIDIIRSQHPELQTIPRWVTREEYSRPKPAPDCYERAIDELAAEGDAVVGFEDTPRGIAALRGTRAQPVIVCPPDYPLLSEVSDVEHIGSLTELR